MKQYLIECKIDNMIIDEGIILATSFKEAEQKLKLQNKDNPLKYKLVGQFIKER